MHEKKASLLIVDDVITNIDVLVEVLGDEYTVRVALDGRAALAGAERFPPDLILLDIMMPEMDGFEVCRRLKENPETRGIPVIFLTALVEDADEVRGFELGAVDYITKPFHPSIVKARVRNHLELKAHRDRLEALVAERTRELEDAHERLRALDGARRGYLNAISHELRTPANGMLVIAELALWEIHNEETKARYTELFGSARERLMTFIESAEQLAATQGEGSAVAVAPVDLNVVVYAALDAFRKSFPDGAFVAPPTRVPLVLGNAKLLEQSLVILLKIARKMAVHGAPILMSCSEEDDMLALKIVFKSAPLSDALQRTFFDEFSRDRISSSVEELGLSIPLAAHLVRAMGGGVDLRNTPSGVEIRLRLRRAA